MNSPKHRAAFMLLTLAWMGLAGCSSEQGERKAFIEFLQTRIVDQPGLRVPKLTADEEKSLGQYSAQYAVIGDFNDRMGQAFNAACHLQGAACVQQGFEQGGLAGAGMAGEGHVTQLCCRVRHEAIPPIGWSRKAVMAVRAEHP